MKNIPKVSVITAVRNSENLIKETVDSVLKQTYRNFEYIIVDDFSEDSTGEILDCYAKKDLRVKVIHNSKRLERCISRNVALKKAEGKYIAVTDGDDISFANRLDVQARYLDTHPDVYLVASRAILVDESGRKIGTSYGKRRAFDVSEELKEMNVLVHSTFMFRNTQEFEYRDKLRSAEDYDLLLQMLAKKRAVHLLPNILVKYRDREDLVYNDYLVDQFLHSQKAKEIYRNTVAGDKYAYEKFDPKNIYEDIPEKLYDEISFFKAFSKKDFKKARKIQRRNLKKYGYTVKSLLYLIDTYTHGYIFHWGKRIKRVFIRILDI